MFFEGAEKKFELVTGRMTPSLRGGIVRWAEIVARAEAKIVSTVCSGQCDAYLLSESSLFVYDHRAVMITCGQTDLVSAALVLLEQLGLDSVEAFIYERKNEQQPEAQKTNFEQDVEALNEVMDGTTLFFGNRDGRNVSLYYLTKPYTPDRSDTTLELLMHHLPKNTEAVFAKNCGYSAKDLGKRTGISQILPGFTVDSLLFDPLGYSLNAVKGAFYFTVHVTPQDPWSYASFETNYPIGDEVTATIDRILDLFSPRHCLALFFQPLNGKTRLSGVHANGRETAVRLSCGYRVEYCEIDKDPSADAGMRLAGRKSVS